MMMMMQKLPRPHWSGLVFSPPGLSGPQTQRKKEEREKKGFESLDVDEVDFKHFFSGV